MNGHPKKGKRALHSLQCGCASATQQFLLSKHQSYLQQIQPGLQSKLSIFKQNVSSPLFTYHLIHFPFLVIVTAINVQRVIQTSGKLCLESACSITEMCKLISGNIYCTSSKRLPVTCYFPKLCELDSVKLDPSLSYLIFLFFVSLYEWVFMA